MMVNRGITDEYIYPIACPSIPLYAHFHCECIQCVCVGMRLIDFFLFLSYDSWSSWILTCFVRVVYLRNTFNYLHRISIPMDFHSVKKEKEKKNRLIRESVCYRINILLF